MNHDYRLMVRIRRFEERAEALFLGGKLPGFVHLSTGQEAVAVGVCSQLLETDLITSTHRGHGHAIAKGMSVEAMFLELFGSRDGACKGKGGSMHIFDYRVGMLGANGVVAAGLAIAAGAGLAAQLADDGRVAVPFFGDGALGRGTLHESLNLAAVWKLPVVFVLEQNGYASTTPYNDTHAYPSAAAFAEGYGLKAHKVDGNDLRAVARAARDLVERARRGDGPGFLEALTTRIKGHYVGDPETYRNRMDAADTRSLDPLVRYRALLLEEGVGEDALLDIEQEEAERVEAAAVKAAAAPRPEAAEALTDLFVEA